MIRALPILALLAMSLAPPALAAENGPDFIVELRPGAEPTYRGPPGVATLQDYVPGQRVSWNLTLASDYTVGEFRIVDAFNVTRPSQVVPRLILPDSEYPLFVQFPGERVWEADGPAQVYSVTGTAQNATLRLGLPGPRNVTLVLERDVTPPVFTLGQVVNVTHRDFFQETRTDELAYANLRIRLKGAAEWVENPTTMPHYLQRFPIQGLRANSEYEAQITFTDWAGNEAKSPLYTLRTTPEPVRPLPVVTILQPAANATLPNGSLLVHARIEAPGSTMQGGSVRLFVDAKEVHDGYAFDGRDLTYRPPLLQPGPHRVAVEATNADGGTAAARWSFTVAGAEETPLPLPLVLAALAAGAVVMRRRA